MDEVDERRPDRAEKRALPGAEARILEAATERRSAELETGDRLVQVFVRPLCEPGVDRGLEMERPLGHTAGRGDHDDHDEVRLQQEHLDVYDRGGLERRRRYEREQT